MKLPIPSKVKDALPNWTEKTLNKQWDKYISIMKKHLTISHMRSRNDKLFIPLLTIRKEMGEWKVQGKRGKTFYTFRDLYPFYYEMQKGNNIEEKITEIKIMDNMSKQVELLLVSSMPEDVLEGAFPKMTIENISSLRRVSIDIKSLKNFIKNTTSHMDNPNKKNQHNSMGKYLKEAKRIMCVVDALVSVELGEWDSDGRFLFPFVETTSPFGRTYHKGINLQSASKIVREAALGECVSYDLNSAALTMKLHMQMRLYKDNGYNTRNCAPKTTEYITAKDSVRKRLAGLLESNKDNIKLIKRLITAISFGAPLTEAAWSLDDGTTEYGSFCKIFRNKSDRKILLGDGWLVAFATEQKQMTDFIIYMADMNDTGQLPHHLPDMKNQYGKWKQSKTMAYIYQQLEAVFIEVIEETYGDDIILSVHDGFYARRELESSNLHTLLLKFEQAIGYNPYTDVSLKFSKEVRQSYDESIYNPEHEKFLKEHKKQMIGEEQRAKRRSFNIRQAGVQ